MSRAINTRPLGRTGLEVTEVGCGTAPLGGLFAPVPEADARAVLKGAWDAGIRYFDTAPMYGLGRCEHLLGDQLRDQTAPCVLSTKVGRLMMAPRAGLTMPPEPPRNPFDTGWKNGLPFREIFDYSYDGIMRSFEDSRQRMGLTRIDLLYVHDIGGVTHGDAAPAHWQNLTGGGGFRALEELRGAGDIRGFGLGVNETQAILDAMEETDPDACLLAGRYSVMDRSAAQGLLSKAQARGMGLVLGGVFNSGILAAPKGRSATFNYVEAPAEIVQTVAALHAVCDAHTVPLGAAAVQFPLRHPAVASVVMGPRTTAELADVMTWYHQDIPEALWADLDAALAESPFAT